MRDKSFRFHAGDVLAGRFRIQAQLGVGGMGEVYAARDLEVDESVALKTIRGTLAGEADAEARFRREIQLARKVTHPNVCRIFDFFHDCPIVGEWTWLLQSAACWRIARN